MSTFEIIAWDGNRRYFLALSRADSVEDIDELSAVQESPAPIVRQYDARDDVLYGWDYLDSIIRMSGDGHFAEQLTPYEGGTTTDELLETATIRAPDELNKGIDIPGGDRT